MYKVTNVWNSKYILRSLIKLNPLGNLKLEKKGLHSLHCVLYHDILVVFVTLEKNFFYLK